MKKKFALFLSVLFVSTAMSGCGGLSSRSYYDFALNNKGDYDGSYLRAEKLNPSDTLNYQRFCFNAVDRIVEAQKRCVYGKYCKDGHMIIAIERARLVLGRAYGPPNGEGARELQAKLYEAEMAVYGFATPKREVNRYAK